MAAAPDPASRRDVVVVMCRGESRRFGGPKALAVLDDDPRPLLRRVVDLHAGTGYAPVVIVTTGELAPGCAALVANLPDVRVTTAPGGGDTARTLAAAWDVLAELAPGWSHAWLHPVDVPTISAATLAQLAVVSGLMPDRQVRPGWNGRPGHPVVLPARVFAELLADARTSPGPWRVVLEGAVRAGRVPGPVTVAVADPGVVLDHDVRPA